MNAMSIDRGVNNKLFFSMAITVCWMLCPVLSAFIIIYLIYKLNEADYSIKYLFLLIALTFGLIAYTAVSVDRGGEPTDITRYTNQFRTLVDIRTVSEFFFTAVLMDGGIYLFFEGVCLVLAKLFPKNPQVLPLFWVTFEYFFLLMGIYELSKYQKYWSKNTFLILLIVILFGTSFFTLQVELLKQASSTALVTYAIFRMLNGKRKNGWLLLLAIMIHASIIILIPIFLFIKKSFINKYYIFILGTAAIVSLIDLNKLISIIGPAALAEKASFYANIETWSINKINYTLVLLYAILIALIIIDSKRKDRTNDFNRLSFNANVLAFSALITQFHSVHNFVRYTYLYSPLYMLAFFSILTGNLNRISKVYVVSLFVLFVIGLNIMYTNMYLNSTYTNSFMDNSLPRILTSNIYTFLKYEAVN